jgi:protease-4
MTPEPPPGQGPAVPPAYGPPRGPMMPPMGSMPPMPPMMMYPPPQYPPPYPPSRGGGGFAKAMLVTLATTLFGLSILLNVYLLLFHSIAGSAQSASEFAGIETPIPSIAPGDPKQKVGVVRFGGVISDETKRPFVMLLEHLRRDPDLKALVLEIDSPGGEVTASDELYDAVLRLKKEKNIPVVISMGSLAASGGYYMAMTGNKIVAQETTLTGSIGVLMFRIDLSQFANKYGVQDGTVVSDGSTFKNAGSPLKPMTDEETQYFKSVLNDSFEVFKQRIVAGRPNMTRQEIDAVANGKIYSAKQALALKLVDRIGYLEDAIADAAQLAGLTKPSAVRVERQRSVFEQLLGGPSAQASKANVSAGGLNVNVDRSLIDTMLTPRPMYLWRGQ